MVTELREINLKEVTLNIEVCVEETQTYVDFLSDPWIFISIEYVIERLNREIGRCGLL